MNLPASLLHTVKSYLLQSVAPFAEEIDTDSEFLRKAIIGLGELNLLALRVPEVWGGLEVDEEAFQSFQELVARYSGALAFLQTQHQSAASMLATSNNSSLKQKYLPLMGKGELLLGVGFSQLRREGEPTIKAVAVEGGYKLDGFVPWVTGGNLFQEFIVAASLSDGSAVFGVVPFVKTHQNMGGMLTFSEPMQLAAMTSTNTVTANFCNWFLADEFVVSMKPPGWIHETDKKNVLRSPALALGCALAGLDILEAAAINKSLPFITEAFASLNAEINRCRTAIREAQHHPDISLAERLQLRAWAIDLAVRCTHAAVTVSSGAANSKNHPAQRVYREAMVFTTSGQTTAIMEATLSRLISKNEEYHAAYSSQISYSKVIHLSHVINSNIPQWPGDPPVEFVTVAELQKDGYYLRGFSLGEHSATHMNAPISFHAEGVGIDEYAANSWVVPAVVINICLQCASNPDYALTISDILDWEEHYDSIPSGCVVILYTGWQEKWVDKTAFLNQDISGKMHFPGFSSEATQFLLEQRSIVGVGIDTHGVDGGQDTTFGTNHLVLEKPRIVLENLTNLEQLPPKGTTLIIGVLRLQGGSGSPAGVLAFVP